MSAKRYLYEWDDLTGAGFLHEEGTRDGAEPGRFVSEADHERALAAALVGVRDVLFAYGDNECTAAPWWAIVSNSMRGHVLHAGPWFSRQTAQSHLEGHRHRYPTKAFVFCFSGQMSEHYQALRETIGAPEKAGT